MYDVPLDKYFAKSFTRILYIYQYELRWNYAKNCRPTVIWCFLYQSKRLLLFFLVLIFTEFINMSMFRVLWMFLSLSI